MQTKYMFCYCYTREFLDTLYISIEVITTSRSNYPSFIQVLVLNSLISVGVRAWNALSKSPFTDDEFQCFFYKSMYQFIMFLVCPEMTNAMYDYLNHYTQGTRKSSGIPFFIYISRSWMFVAWHVMWHPAFSTSRDVLY